MRLPSLFASLALLLAHVLPSIASRTLESRALAPTVDVCAYVDTNIYTQIGLVHIGTAGDVKLCLCASLVRPYVQANLVLKVIATVLGENAVVNALLNFINTHGTQCQYPPHAVPICQASQPCDFGCGDGYSRVGNTCVCPAPNIECNGVCQSQACGTLTPQNPSKRSLSPPAARSRMRILTDERCQRGYRLCGSPGTKRSGMEDWECIDTRSTLDSCGGCMYHHILDDRPVEGTDCSSLPGVSGVQCKAGNCVVHRCKQGWSLSPSGSECISPRILHDSRI